MKEYRFYGHDVTGIKPIHNDYPQVTSIQRLYDLLSSIWCEYTCAPRMRQSWSKENKTLGQCSITAFLVQDIFGGEVLGIPLKEGGFHCFNVVEGKKFDLTSEQFGDENLDYEHVVPQSREVHFSKAEKYERYLYLCNQLKGLQ